MKQLIVMAAILPLLLVFLMQYTLDQKNSISIGKVQEQVYAAKEKAKQEGCFTEEIKADLRSGISQSLNIPENDIVIEATETRQYRINYFDSGGRGMINYRVTVPIRGLMAGGRLFQIDDDKNIRYFSVEGSTASERLPFD